MKLKPFFCFYGGKYRAAPYYPKPIHNIINEPFAGGAGYSIRNYSKNIILNDVDPVIFGVWHYLINSDYKEIMSLPIDIEHIDELNVNQEAKWLIGFWLNKATTRPGKQFSSWSSSRPNSFWGSVIRERIASQVSYIKHWKIYNKNYLDIDNNNATWFIDPPYNNKAGSHYKHHKINYTELGNWSKNRNGQIIVCEQLGANWLPFEYFREIRTSEGKYGKGKSKEVIFYREENINNFDVDSVDKTLNFPEEV